MLLERQHFSAASRPTNRVDSPRFPPRLSDQFSEVFTVSSEECVVFDWIIAVENVTLEAK